MPVDIAINLSRIRAFAASKGWGKSRLAKEAGLNLNTLRHLHEADWNPTSETVAKLEAIIPREFSGDDKGPSVSPRSTAGVAA